MTIDAIVIPDYKDQVRHSHYLEPSSAPMISNLHDNHDRSSSNDVSTLTDPTFQHQSAVAVAATSRDPKCGSNNNNNNNNHSNSSSHPDSSMVIVVPMVQAHPISSDELRLAQAEDEEAVGTPISQPQQQQAAILICDKPQKQSNKFLICTMAVIICILVIGITIVIIVVSSSDDDNSQEPQTLSSDENGNLHSDKDIVNITDRAFFTDDDTNNSISEATKAPCLIINNSKNNTATTNNHSNNTEIQKIVSDFEQGNDGWTVGGDGQNLHWVSSSVDGNGFLVAHDGAQGVGWYFQAPLKFLGNKQGARSLSFDLRQQYTDEDAEYVVDARNVLLTSSNNDVSIYHKMEGVEQYPVDSSWTSYTVDFTISDDHHHWYYLENDELVTESKVLQNVLSNLAALYIYGEYYLSYDVGMLDNVILEVAAATSSDDCNN